MQQAKAMPPPVESGPASPGGSKIPVPKRFTPAADPVESKENTFIENEVMPPGAPAVSKKSTDVSTTKKTTMDAMVENTTTNAPAAAPTANDDTAALNETLGRVLGQLDLVTEAIINMEQRLRISESRTSEMYSKMFTNGEVVVEPSDETA